MSTSATPFALEVTDMSKSFGGTQALQSVDLEVRRGEIHALVGENGCGKSTLVKILSGFYTPDPGSNARVGGHTLEFGNVSESAACGLRFVHQDLGLVNELDCTDNFGLGNGYRTGRGGRIRWRDQRTATRAAVAKLGYDIDVGSLVGSLTGSQKTAVAIARALSAMGTDTHLLVLDEPTANLPRAEVKHLFDVLRRIRDSGVSILFISHHFDEIMDLADRVTVLRDGCRIATRDIAEITQDQLIELMLGRPLEVGMATHTVQSIGSPMLRLENVSGRVVSGVSLEVRAGEVVGIAGISGSGAEEIACLVSGQHHFDGHMSLQGATLPPGRPDIGIRAGVVAVPANRQISAILADHSVRENITIGNLKPYVRVRILRRALERSDVVQLLDAFDIRPRDPNAMIGNLSGGNQQKAMIARALRLSPRLLVLDEPTQGVDVGAQAEIHRLIRKAAEGGMAVLVCSSVSEELTEIADRVLVMRSGNVVRELHRPLDADQITAATLTSQEERQP